MLGLSGLDKNEEYNFMNVRAAGCRVPTRMQNIIFMNVRAARSRQGHLIIWLEKRELDRFFFFS